jgi:hypothetical protein
VATLDLKVGMMPPHLQEVAAIIGPTLAIRYARRFGGQKIYLPARPFGTHPLVRCLGMSAAQLLCEDLRPADRGDRGDRYVPSASAYLTWLDARALRVCGLSQADIGRRLGVSTRHAERLLVDFDTTSIEVNNFVRSVAKRYGVGRRQAEPAIPAYCPQRDFGWPRDPRGLRFAGA